LFSAYRPHALAHLLTESVCVAFAAATVKGLRWTPLRFALDCRPRCGLRGSYQLRAQFTRRFESAITTWAIMEVWRVGCVLVLPAAVAKRRLPCFRVGACGQQAKHPERPEREAQLETHALAMNR